MNSKISRYFFYYPSTFIKGEMVSYFLKIYLRNQYADDKYLEDLQFFHLKKLLDHAYSNCEFYRHKYKNFLKFIYEIKSIKELNQLPTINKQEIINNQNSLSANLSPIRISKKTTGGSSGHPVTILKNITALARERAATWRGYSWAGIQVSDPQARFWGVSITKTNRFKNTIVDIIANRIKLSAFDINSHSLNKYYYKIVKFQPAYLYGYVSMIDIFCEHLHKEGLKLPNSVISIITTSELLTDSIRKRIESYTGLPVFNEYGCGEVGSIAHECSHGSMHIMADNLILESDQNDEIIVTDLHNYAMPLIRYRLNDFGKLSHKSCRCGCTFPILEKIYGRAYDIITLPNGNKTHPEIIMYIFEEFKEKFKGLIQFQFVQHSKRNYSVNLVVDNTYDKDKSEKYLIYRINNVLYENVLINFNYIDMIQREKSGKIRLIKSEI